MKKEICIFLISTFVLLVLLLFLNNNLLVTAQLNSDISSNSNLEVTNEEVAEPIIQEENEEDISKTIEQGIEDSLLGDKDVLTNQQIYIVNEHDEHFLGTFDKAVIQGNQTWAFNYKTSEEEFTKMPSLFNTFNVQESRFLTLKEIIKQVSNFITSTKF